MDQVLNSVTQVPSAFERAGMSFTFATEGDTAMAWLPGERMGVQVRFSPGADMSVILDELRDEIDHYAESLRAEYMRSRLV